MAFEIKQKMTSVQGADTGKSGTSLNKEGSAGKGGCC